MTRKAPLVHGLTRLLARTAAQWGPLRIILMDPSAQSQRPVLDMFGAWLPGKVVLENQAI